MRTTTFYIVKEADSLTWLYRGGSKWCAALMLLMATEGFGVEADLIAVEVAKN